MNRILIVDDEAYFRQYLKASFPWKSLGFEICGEACNGKDALRMIPSLAPDLILSDIHMNEMDGISFAKQAKQLHPRVHIILITGYNEFEYAKQAVKIGVANFISKPFEKQELIDSVQHIRADIDKGCRQEEMLSALRKNYSDTIPFARDALLYRLIRHGVSPEIRRKLSSLRIPLPPCPIVAVIAEFGTESDREAAAERQLKTDLTAAFTQFTGIRSVVFEHDGKLLAVCGLGSPQMGRYLEVCCERMISDLSAKSGIPVTVGIGTVCSSYDGIAQSYGSAEAALRNKFLLGSNRVIPFDKLEIAGAGKEEVYPFEFKNNLLMYLRLLDAEKVRTTMTDVYDFIRKKPISIDFIYILYTELLSNCFSCLAEYRCKLDEVFGKGFSPFDELLQKRTLREAHQYVTGVYLKVILFLKNRKKQNSVSAVKKAKEYIDKHFSDSGLTTDEIAANTFFHPSYLRFIFKKEMGITVNEYLTKTRMERAKKLLGGGLSNSAVADRVGYSDPAYFSKCFKKYYKMNPSEYEKSAGRTAGGPPA